jgi:hypothetical protein
LPGVFLNVTVNQAFQKIARFIVESVAGACRLWIVACRPYARMRERPCGDRLRRSRITGSLRAVMGASS